MLLRLPAHGAGGRSLRPPIASGLAVSTQDASVSAVGSGPENGGHHLSVVCHPMDQVGAGLPVTVAEGSVAR